MKRRILAMFLCISMIFSLTVSAYAGKDNVFTPSNATERSVATPSDADQKTETVEVRTDSNSYYDNSSDTNETIIATDSNATIYAYADDLTFEVTGNLPEDAELVVEPMTDAAEYIHSNVLALEELPEGYTGLAYDISIIVDGEKIQPNENVVVRVSGTDTTEESDVAVFHLPDTTAEELYQIIQAEMGIVTFARMRTQTKTIEDIKPDELDANAGEGYIEFKTDGFSVYYIVAGTESKNIGNDQYYILQGTTLELKNVTSDNYNVSYPENLDGEQCGVKVERNGNTLSFIVSASARLGEYKIEYPSSGWGSSTYTVTIYIMSPLELFNLNRADLSKKVVFTILGNSKNVPNEPMTGGSYSNWIYVDGKNQNGYTFASYAYGNNTGVYQSSPEGFIDLEAVAASTKLVQNLDGQNVIGVIDSGWGKDTLPLINMDAEEWNELLEDVVAQKQIIVSTGGTGTKTLSASDLEEKNADGSYRYKIYPYVVKWILDDSDNNRGWHVDCCVVDTMTYSVSYDYNLSPTLILQESSDLTMPDRSFYTPNTTGIRVGYMKLGNTNVIGDKTVEFYDSETLSTNEYKFLYWNTEPDGSGITYNPGEQLPPITSNVVLYAIWNHTQTSGTVKIEKMVVFDDPNDERKDDNISYSFTVTIANAEVAKGYPYTIYNADGTTKTEALELVSGNTNTIQLLDGEYAIISNVPGGNIEITESVDESTEFAVSWEVGTTTTEGNTVTATVTAGNQTVIECINTYAPLVADLTIVKQVASMPDQSFIFTVNGMPVVIPVSAFRYSDDAKMYTASVTIKDLVIGTNYSVVEDPNWSWRYELDGSDGTSGTIVKGGNTATFTNIRDNNKWLDGSTWCQNLFTKDGIIQTPENIDVDS